MSNSDHYPLSERNNMNKLKATCIICLICILTGCVSSPNTVPNSTIFNNDYQYTASPTFSNEDDQYYFRHYTVGDMTMAESKDGYYFFSGPGDHYLYYMDKINLKTIILCNKPECLHADETDPAKKSNCNAFFLHNNANLMYYNSYLYALDRFPDIQNGSRSIYQISLDGVQRKEIYTFKEQIETITIHRGFIYYTISDNGTIAGKEYSSYTTTSLYRISVNNIAKEPELLFAGKGIYNRVSCLTGYKDGVYFINYNYKDEKIDELTSMLCRYDINNKSTSAIRGDVGVFSIVNDKFIYNWTDTKMYECNIDGSSPEDLNIPMGIIYGDKTNIIDDTLPNKIANRKDKNIKRNLIISDIKGNILHIFDIDSFGLDFSYGGDDLYFFVRDISQANEYGTITNIYAIDKSKFRTENWTMNKVFQFVPKTQDNGYITSD